MYLEKTIDEIEHYLVYDVTVVDNEEDVRKELIVLENKYNCKIECYKENINSLQREWTFVVHFDNTNWVFEIEEGINNGTVVTDVYEDDSAFEFGTDKLIEVLDDIIIDDTKVESKLQLEKMRAVLEAHKEELIEIHNKEKYDTYMTGVGSNLKYSNSLLTQIPLKYIYKTISVDKNAIKI